MGTTSMRQRPLAAMLTVCGLAILGSPGCEREERPIPESDLRQAQVSIFNATHDVLGVNIDSLNSEYRVDCSLVGRDPGRFVRTDHLSSGVRLELLSGEERSLIHGSSGSGLQAGSQACLFAFINPRDERLSPLVATWPRDLEQKDFFIDVDAPADVPPEAPTVLAEAIYDDAASDAMRPWRHRPCGSAASLSLNGCSEEELAQLQTPPPGATYHWSVLGEEVEQSSWEPQELETMPVEDGESCATGRDSTPLNWETPPTSQWKVDEVVDLGIDDGDDSDPVSTPPPSEQWQCYDVYLSAEDDEHVWQFCGSPRLAQRLSAASDSSQIYVEFFRSSRYEAPPSAYESLTIDLERRTDDGERYEDELFELVRGHGVPEHFGLSWSTTPRTDCDARREFPDCEKVVLPTTLDIEASDAEISIAPGETVDLEPDSQVRIDERRRLEFVRGFHRAVSDRSCSHESLGPQALSQVGPYVEIIYYGGVTAVAN